jgi:hypothetical protein
LAVFIRFSALPQAIRWKGGTFQRIRSGKADEGVRIRFSASPQAIRWKGGTFQRIGSGKAD